MTITVTNIKKKGTNSLIIDNVSFKIQEGIITCLIGISGCGKTTIANTIVGFSQADNGSIHIDNVDITNSSIYNRNMRIVARNPVLIPYMSSIENIKFGFRDTTNITAAEKARIAGHILEIMDMKDQAYIATHLLSQQQKQIIGICMAMVDKSELLIIDEALDALDKDKCKKITKLINKHQHPRILLITNEYNKIKNLADHIITISNGTVVSEGNYNTLSINPQHIDTAKLLKVQNIVNYKVIECNNNYMILLNNNQHYLLKNEDTELNNTHIHLDDTITVKLLYSVCKDTNHDYNEQYNKKYITLSHYPVIVKTITIEAENDYHLLTVEDINNPSILLELNNISTVRPGSKIYIKLTKAYVLSKR